MVRMIPKAVAAIRQRWPRTAEISIFIETGTYRGWSIERMVGIFETLHTIELSDRLFAEATARLTGQPINFHHGDSRQLLPQILQDVDQPVFFYIDAHWCKGPGTAGKEDFPLWGELDIIRERPFADVISIDDISGFGKHPKQAGPHWKGVSVRGCLERLGAETIADHFRANDQLNILRIDRR